MKARQGERWEFRFLLGEAPQALTKDLAGADFGDFTHAHLLKSFRASRFGPRGRREDEVATFRKHFRQIAIIWSLIFFGVGAYGDALGNNMTGALYILISVYGLLMFWGIYLFVKGKRVLDRILDRALRPIPSPGEIAAQLTPMLGRSPTIEEVAAVHNLMVQDRNFGIAQAAALLGGAWVAKHW